MGHLSCRVGHWSRYLLVLQSIHFTIQHMAVAEGPPCSYATFLPHAYWTQWSTCGLLDCIVSRLFQFTVVAPSGERLRRRGRYGVICR